MFGASAVISLMLLNTVWSARQESFHCDSLYPVDRKAIEAQITSSNSIIFQIATEDITADKPVTVNIGSALFLKDYIIQAREINSNAPIGTWSVPGDGSITRTCFSNADSVVHYGELNLNEIATQWSAPASLANDIDIQFIISVVAADDRFWVGVKSKPFHVSAVKHVVPAETTWKLPQPTTGPSTTSKTTPQSTTTVVRSPEEQRYLSLILEEDTVNQYEIKLNKMIDNDQKESDGNSEILNEKRRLEEMRHQEIMDYERRKAKEERERQERIRIEIYEKEEYERSKTTVKPTPKPTKEIDGLYEDKEQDETDGAARMTINILSLLTTFALLIHQF